jgi:hypothetical protein
VGARGTTAAIGVATIGRANERANGRTIDRNIFEFLLMENVSWVTIRAAKICQTTKQHDFDSSQGTLQVLWFNQPHCSAPSS